MTWARLSLTLLLLATALCGCTQQALVPPADFPERLDRATALREPSSLSTLPTAPGKPSRTPATVNHLDREPRFLSLQEALAIALEQGATGIQSAGNAGSASDELVSFNGSSASGTDSIRVLALEPAIAGAAIEG